jgi:recombinational DNA repair protein (RecF pathway)
MQAEPLIQAACAVIAEVSSSFAQEAHEEPEGFRLIGAVLEELERGGNPWVLLRYFEYWTLRIHGLLPDLYVCASCSRPLGPRSGHTVKLGAGVCCRDCAQGAGGGAKRLAARDREFLDSVRRRPPSEMPANAGQARTSGAVETLLRGTLEAYAERSFRAYRHFRTAEAFAADGGQR